MGGTGKLGGDVRQLLQSPNAGRPFLAGLDCDRRNDQQILTVHAAATSMSSRQARALKSQLRQHMPQHRVKVRRHPARTLAGAQSLETFFEPFGHEDVVFDPAGVFARGKELLKLVEIAKAIHRGSVKKALWHSPSGTLFIVLDFHRLAKAPRKDTIIAAIDAKMRRLLEESADRSFIKLVRITYHEPQVPTVPVDAASIEKHDSVLGKISKKVYVSSIAASLGFGAVAARAEDMSGNQAVSSPNGELAIMGGQVDDEDAFFAEGALTQPLGEEHGVRLDGVAGSVDGDFVGGVGAHLFWRDPSVGLVGVAAGYLRAETNSAAGSDQEIGIVAAEGELYYDQVTVSGLAGYQFSDTSGGDGFVGRVDLEIYPDDDLMLVAGVETNPQNDVLGRLGVEYRPSFDALPGLSIFVEGAIGEDSYSRAFGGIRYYFGQSVSLRERHRRDTFRSHLLPTRMIDGLDQGAAYGE